MGKLERAVLRHSIKDVIDILQNEPVRPDLVAELTVAQIMNRVSIAHLSIERAMKFLITEAGCSYEEIHDLHLHYQRLRNCDPQAADYLETAFQAAVGHYRYNPNRTDLKHLKNLEGYLKISGSNQAFQDIRYWEMAQPLDQILIRQIYLSLHIELLHGLGEILLAPNRPMDTVVERVERAVLRSMRPRKELTYQSGTPEEISVKAYTAWLNGYQTHCEALAHAVENKLEFGDHLIEGILENAYRSLLKEVDPAIRYFASTLDILPKQERSLDPPVEWRGEENYQRGLVKTPSGIDLGLIERGLDSLWYITPFRCVTVGTCPKAATQTDARIYLASVTTSPALIIRREEELWVRLVEQGYDYFGRNHDQISQRYEGSTNTDEWTHKVAFWDIDHTLQSGQEIKIEVPARDIENLIDVFEGRVLSVVGQEVYMSGFDSPVKSHGRGHWKREIIGAGKVEE